MTNAQVPLPEWELETLTDLYSANDLSGIPPYALAGMAINESGHGEVGGAGVNPEGYGGYYGEATSVIPAQTLKTSSLQSFIDQSKTVAKQLAGYGSSAGTLGDVAIFNIGGGPVAQGGSAGGVDWQRSIDAQLASDIQGYDTSSWQGTEPVGQSAGGASPTAAQIAAAIGGAGATTSYTSTPPVVTSGGGGGKPDVTATQPAPSVIPNIFNWNPLKGLDAVGQFFGGLSSPELWLRVGEVALGVLIIAGSAVLFVAILAAKNEALSAITAVTGLGKVVGLGRKTETTLAGAGAGASSSASSGGESFARWQREGSRRISRSFETGDTRESADLDRWAREQSRQSREIRQRHRPRYADEGEF